MASSKRDKKRMSFILKKDEGEKRRLYKRAAQMRKAAREPEHGPKHRRDWSDADDWDGDNQPDRIQKRRRRGEGSLQDWAERLAVEEVSAPQPSDLAAPEVLEEAVVLTATSAGCRVRFADGAEQECMLPPEIAAFQRSELAVGDRVQVAFGDDAAPATVAQVLPRRSALSRPDSGPGGEYRERVIAANVDVVVIVAAVADPPLRPRLLDRYLIAVEYGGADGAVALTKTDLLAEEAELDDLYAQLSGLVRLGVPVVSTSTVDGRGLDELRALLAGQTAVFVGQSGVGKSSLLNSLDPGLELATQPVGSTHKGRHTTTASTLHELPDDTHIIDTPGIREFGLWEITRPALRGYFHEFDAYAPGCRFTDCSHLHEPDCAVKAAVEQGDVDEARYDGYRRIWETLRP